MRHSEAAFERVMRAGAAGAVAAVSRGLGDLASIAGGGAAPDRPMTTSTLVPWSCAGKPLLAVACLRLAAAGVLELDSAVAKWRPEFGLLHPRQLPLGCENEDWHTSPGLGFCVGMKALGLGMHCSRLSFGCAGALGGGNPVVDLVEPRHDIIIAAAVGCLGRRAAFALKAVVTALYEDVLTAS